MRSRGAMKRIAEGMRGECPVLEPYLTDRFGVVPGPEVQRGAEDRVRPVRGVRQPGERHQEEQGHSGTELREHKRGSALSGGPSAASSLPHPQAQARQ